MSDRMPLIYVSGPIRNPDPSVVEKNIRAADAVGQLVAGMGAIPVVVHTMYRSYQGLPAAWWDDACRRLLAACHAMAVTVPHTAYAGSSGTTDEVGWAREDDKLIFYNELPASGSADNTVRSSEGLALRTILPSGGGGALGLPRWIRDWHRFLQD